MDSHLEGVASGRVKPAQAGATIIVPTMGYPATMVVEKSCGTNDRYSAWYCVTHRKHLNQFEKDLHIHRGSHTLAWMCGLHGAEQP
jgi:hypothetical protein